MDGPPKPASLGAPAPVQGVHPQTSKDDFRPLKSPFSTQAPGHDNRSQVEGPSAALGWTRPCLQGWRQREGREGSNEA